MADNRTIRLSDAIEAVRNIPPEWARSGPLADSTMVTIKQAGAALSALPAVGDNPDLLTLMAVVSAAGGEVVVLPKDAVKASEMLLERFADPKSGGFVFRLTPLPAPPIE